MSDIDLIPGEIKVNPNNLFVNMPKNESVMKWHATDHEGMKCVPLQITSPAVMPNRWYRFWARVLLNVTWEPFNEH